MKFTKIILETGLTILHEERDVPVTTVMLAAKYGAAHEIEQEKGIAHFIEHMCFKGTHKRDMHEIAAAIENVGGEMNAFTHEELTAYYAKVPGHHVALALDVLFDIYFNPTFPEEEITKECAVICEELRMYKDNPRTYVLEKIKEQLYQKPFGMGIGGTEETVRRLCRDNIVQRHAQVYVPKNSILCIVGSTPITEVIGLVNSLLSKKMDSAKIDLQEITPQTPIGCE